MVGPLVSENGKWVKQLTFRGGFQTKSKNLRPRVGDVGMGAWVKVQLGVYEKGKSPSRKHLRTLVAGLSPSTASECEPDKEEMPSLLVEGHRAGVCNWQVLRGGGSGRGAGGLQNNTGKKRCAVTVHTTAK